MPRLFIALELPENARDSLAEIAGDLPGADWAYSEQYHLTLRFLGEVDPASFDAVREGLGSLTAKSFYLDLRGLGVFPLRGDPETLWAGVERNGALISLRNQVESVVTRKGLPVETRKFHPHVTLGGVRGCRPEWVGAFVAMHSLFSVAEIPVQTFTLFSSKRGPGGAEYTVEERYVLEGILEGE